MQTSEQTKTNLRRYDSLTHRGQARRLRELAKSALRQFGIRVHRLELIKHLVNTTFRLRSSEGEFLVRIHREKNHTVRLVESELAWLLALSKEADVTVQTPYLAPDGRMVVLAEAAGLRFQFSLLISRRIDLFIYLLHFLYICHYLLI